jgi:hypothetical protein
MPMILKHRAVPNALAPPLSPDEATLSAPAKLLLHELELALADRRLAAAFTKIDLGEATGFSPALLDRAFAELMGRRFIYGALGPGLYVIARRSPPRRHDR